MNNEEGKWVVKLFELYAEGKSVTHISNLFYSKGIKPRKSKSGIFNIGTLRMMLRNEIYIGIDKMKDPDEPEKILEYKGVPKIITKKVFQFQNTDLDDRLTCNRLTGWNRWKCCEHIRLTKRTRLLRHQPRIYTLPMKRMSTS